LDLIVVFFVGVAGALVGTFTGILLLRRKLRPPVSEAEFAELKAKLQAGETSLAAASANAKELRAELALQQTALLQSREDATKRLDQLDAEAAEKQKEKAQRTVAEKRALELSAEVTLLTERCTGLETQAKQERDRTAEMGGRLISAEGEVESSRKKMQQLTEQADHLVAESTELKRSNEELGRVRLDLETQLNFEREALRQLHGQVVELQKDRSQLEIRLKEEMGSAAKGMELLLMAQQKLSSAFKGLGPDGQTQNGNGSQTTSNGNGSQATPNGNGSQTAPAATRVNADVGPEAPQALVSSAHSS
jgi:chromosome segregation ATPase